MAAGSQQDGSEIAAGWHSSTLLLLAVLGLVCNLVALWGTRDFVALWLSFYLLT